ncbi:hypothetical protein [Tenggerimyces flavus]|uniref:Right handed beta helix domain-containing protein n=1 Tax=Tenggerimyces flavus TaxID=1708749 RepID=A0ABV7YA79_9ACTN|nr:hypothetical protein [Tenggerimyces flavus]MBM7788893.1 hypothetical protein [Tenggerimyces flavus]
MPVEVPTTADLLQVVREVWPGDDLLDAVDIAADGGGAILLGPGTHVLYRPLNLPSYVRLVGAGTGATSIRAGADMEYLIGVDDHASSVSVEKLRIECAGKARTGVRIVPAPRDPANGLDYGVTSPDPRHRMFDVEVYDAAHSGVVLGEHARGTRLDHVLVRRAGTVGFHCGMADSYLTNCEATVVAGPSYSAAAAFWIGSVNTVYANCKGWWGRGSGWRVRGSRNRFVACESQDTAWHGWYVEYDLNTFTACVADSAGFAASGGIGGVDGFYFAGAGATTATGCLAFNRSKSAKSQRHGFNIPAEMLAIELDGTERFWGNQGRDNAGLLVNVRG